MSDVCPKRDLVKSPIAYAFLWGLPIVTILVTAYFGRERWIITTGWSVSLLIMGSACLVNARGCGRIHCFFTGPFFLIVAVVSLMYGLGLLPLGNDGWQYIGTALLAGGVLLYFVPEWIWDRYRRAPTGISEG